MADNYYDLDYTGSQVDNILDTGYELQNSGYIFRGLASQFVGTPTERTWLIAPTGSTGFGLSTPVPPGSIGICLYDGSSWSASVLNTVTLESTPTAGSGNGITSGAVKTLGDALAQAVNSLASSVNSRIENLNFEETTSQSSKDVLLSIALKSIYQGEEETITSFSLLSATASKAGLMSAADKAKLDAYIDTIRTIRLVNITTSADKGSQLDLSLKWTVNSTQEMITYLTLLAATTDTAGLMSAADKTKLDRLNIVGCQYAGIATPSTTPLVVDARIFYIAVQGGNYSNFGLTVPEGISILKNEGYGWAIENLVRIDVRPTDGSAGIARSGGTYAMISAETSARESADETLSAAVVAEQNARIAAIQKEETARKAAIQEEKNARIAAVQKEETARKAAIQEEKNAREHADGMMIHEIDTFEQGVRDTVAEYKPIVIQGDVQNAPDEVDLTSTPDNLLKFKDNIYNTVLWSGMGRIYLRKNIIPDAENYLFDGFVSDVPVEGELDGEPDAVFWDRINTVFVGEKDDVYYEAWTGCENYVPARQDVIYMYDGTPYVWDGDEFAVDEDVVPNLKNILTQEMLSHENTIYVIRWDYDLDDATLEVPANCILEFNGGKLANGTLACNRTTIVNDSDSFILDDIEFIKTAGVDTDKILLNEHIVADWFISDQNDASDGINAAVRASYVTDISEVRLKRYKYSITSPIYLYNKSRLIGRSGGLKTPSNGQTYGYLTSVTYIFVRASVDGIIVTPLNPPVNFGPNKNKQFSPDADQDGDQSAVLSLDSVAIHNIFLNYNTVGSSVINYNNSIKDNYGIHVCNQYTYEETVTVEGEEVTVDRRYPIVFSNSDFQNVGVNNFRYGIYIENRFYYPSGSAEWSNVICSNNHVGMVIQGGGKDAHGNTNGVWCNCFHFDACIFANNYLGGVYIDNVYQTELVKFENCVMEGNGSNYNPAMLWDVNIEDEDKQIYTYHPKLDGVSLGAYALRCNGMTGGAGLSNNGQVILDNCYVEWNYFRRADNIRRQDRKEGREPMRTEAIEGLEAPYFGNNYDYISPLNVMKNSYAIQSDRIPVVVTKSRLSFLIKIAYIHGARYWEKDNFVRFEVRPAPSFYPNLFDRDDYLVYYKMFSAGWYSDLTIEETFDYNKTEAATIFLYVKKFVESNRVLSLVKCINNDCLPDIHVKVPNEPELDVREKNFTGELWLRKDNNYVSITGICTYFSEGYDIPDLDRLCSLATTIDGMSIFNVSLRKPGIDTDTGNIRKYYIDDPISYNVDRETDPEHVQVDIVYGGEHRHGFHMTPYNFPDDFTTNSVIEYPIIQHRRLVSYTVRKPTEEDPGDIRYFQLEPKRIYNNLVIEHFNFIMEGGDGNNVLKPAMKVVGGNLVEFNYCIINVGQGQIPLITTDIDGLVIRFNNCTFTMTSTTTYGPAPKVSDKPKITDNPRNVVEYNNCTADGVTLISYAKSGLFADRPAFDNELCAGFEYFCTDRNYTIYYGGNSNWYDSTGTIVTQ